MKWLWPSTILAFSGISARTEWRFSMRESQFRRGFCSRCGAAMKHLLDFGANIDLLLRKERLVANIFGADVAALVDEHEGRQGVRFVDRDLQKFEHLILR